MVQQEGHRNSIPYPAEPHSKVDYSRTAQPIADHWELVGAPGLKGFNGRAGDKGAVQYLLGFDTEFVEKAQAHIPDGAAEKRVKREAYVNKVRNNERRRRQRREDRERKRKQ